MQGSWLGKEPHHQESPDRAGRGLEVHNREDLHPGGGRLHQPGESGGRQEAASVTHLRVNFFIFFIWINKTISLTRVFVYSMSSTVCCTQRIISYSINALPVKKEDENAFRENHIFTRLNGLITNVFFLNELSAYPVLELDSHTDYKHTWHLHVQIEYVVSDYSVLHTGEFPRGVGHRVENGWGLTKVAVVLLIGLIW